MQNPNSLQFKNQNHNSDKRPEISVVSYTRNEADIIEEYVDEVMDVLEKSGKTYEVIYVNVPAKDKTYEVLQKLGDKYEHFYPVNMANLTADRIQKGYQMLLACKYARGKKIIVIDSDGQPDPNDFDKVLKKFDDGADAVMGWRQEREGKHGFFYNLTSYYQNILTRLLGGIKIHDKNVGLKAFTDVAAKSMMLYGRNFRDLAIQLQEKGFVIDEVSINWRKRTGGIQSFKFMDRLLGGTFDLLADVIVAKMVDKPFRFWGLVTTGLGAISFMSFLVGVILAIFTDFASNGITFWPIVWIMLTVFFSVAMFVSFCAGIIMEFMVSQRHFNLDDYYIIDDYKGLIK
ncbi:glycosyltransferase [Candidatus Dojkabacteria bacterium]|nr:glycosyltransferase [Candidatus Dojkabacteria bacterium]